MCCKPGVSSDLCSYLQSPCMTKTPSNSTQSIPPSTQMDTPESPSHANPDPQPLSPKRSRSTTPLHGTRPSAYHSKVPPGSPSKWQDRPTSTKGERVLQYPTKRAQWLGRVREEDVLVVHNPRQYHHVHRPRSSLRTSVSLSR